MPARPAPTSIVSSSLAALLESGEFSDVSLEVHTEEHGDGGAVEMFAAHRAILWNHSSVFARMFTGNFDEKSQVGIGRHFCLYAHLPSVRTLYFLIYQSRRKLL